MTDYDIIRLRLDYVALVIICLATLLLARRIRHKHNPDTRNCRHIALITLLFLAVGFLATELTTRSRFHDILDLYTSMMAKQANQQGRRGLVVQAPPDAATLARLKKSHQVLLQQNKFLQDAAILYVDPASRSATYLIPRNSLPPEEATLPIVCSDAMLAACEPNRERPSADILKISAFTEMSGALYYRIHKADATPTAIYALYVRADNWVHSLTNIRLLTLGALYLIYLLYVVGTTMLCINRAEIRQRQIAEEELRRARDAADEANRAKSEFLAVMSHEIRTPLTAVIGFNNILAETPLTEIQRRYVNNIQSASQRLTSLLGDVLDFSKIEDRKVILENIPYQPLAVIHEVIDLLGIRASEKNLTIIQDNQVEPSLTLDGDPSRLRQVVTNLLSNALKFTDQGSVTVRTHWRPPRHQTRLGQLTVEVIDTGVGIASSQLANLFNMFVQVQPGNHRRYGGSGLGLAICKRLIELMGGSISVESTLGEGTRFAIQIPATLHLSTDAAARVPGEDSTANASSDLPQKKALIVEDHPMNRELLKLILSRQGFDSEIAINGHEAISLASATRYDVIFMDIEMPELDGFAATRAIRAQEKPGQRALIFAVTAITLVGTREKCLNAGMDDYLTKPVYLPALKNVLVAHQLIPAPVSSNNPTGERNSRSPLNAQAPTT